MVDQLADLFRTTNKVKTQQVTRSRGHRCGDIELVVYLSNTAGPDEHGGSGAPSQGYLGVMVVYSSVCDLALVLSIHKKNNMRDV